MRNSRFEYYLYKVCKTWVGNEGELGGVAGLPYELR